MSTDQRQQAKLLIIDDDATLAGAIHRRFVENSRFFLYIVEVATGTDAFQCGCEMLRQRTFDAVVLDMRDGARTIAGLKLAEQLRHIGQYDTVVVVFTGYPEFDNCVHCMRLGAWDYIPKDSEGGALTKLLQSVECGLRRRFGPENQPTPEWLTEHQRRLSQTYPDEYLALVKGEVVAHAKTEVALREELRQNLPAQLYAEVPYVMYVAKDQTEG